MIHNGLQVDKKYTQMTLAISVLKNKFPLHAKTQDYHLKCLNLPLQMSYIW